MRFVITVILSINCFIAPVFGQALINKSGSVLVNKGSLILKGSWINEGAFEDHEGTVVFAGTAGSGVNFTSTDAQFCNIIVNEGILPGFSTNPNSLIKFSGNFTNNNTALTVTTNATFTINGSGNQLISSASTGANATFGHMVIDKTGGSAILASAINASGNLILAQGTLSSGTGAGFNLTVSGTLSLTGDFSIDLGTGAHLLTFDASNGLSWTVDKKITVSGWVGAYDGTSGTSGQLFVGTTASGLTAGQLDQIKFFNGTSNILAVILSDGEIVPYSPPSNLSYNTPNYFEVNSAITPLSPTVTGKVDTYTINPALPTGLEINAGSGIISGTPTVSSAPVSYTVTATNFVGNTTFDILIAVVYGKVWNGVTSTDWAVGTNWSGAIVPNSTDSVLIPGDMSNYPVLSSTATIKVLNINNTGSGASLTVAGGGDLTLSGAAADYTLVSSGGTLIQTGGEINVATKVPTIAGTFTQSGGIYLSDKNLILSGTLNQSGGLIHMAVNTGTNPTNNLDQTGGIINQSGGTINSKDYGPAAGIFNQTSASAILRIYQDWKPTSSHTFNATNGTVRFSGTAGGLANFLSTNTQFHSVTIDASVDPGFGYDNNGIIMVGGNWTNNSSAFSFNLDEADNPTSGTTVTLNGSAQNIDGAVTTSFLNLAINSGASVTLASAMVGVIDLTIASASSLNLGVNKIQISGTITNSGTISASAGTVEMNGTAAQSIPANVFTANTLKDLIINNAAGLTLQGTLNITGKVTANGNVITGDYLTLISSATKTALIDGSGTGTISGNVTMQRYLASGFGYKYFSSPFTAAMVSEFGDDMDLNATFPTFFTYDENLATTGWVEYTASSGVLSPIHGYAVNFGSGVDANTVDVTGVVNDGSLSRTLYNNDQPYTSGFNLVGNPYPSPIDWDAVSGWTKTNIDDAIYYFKAGGADQYSGTYGTYINQVSSDGLASNIIPSMQGFFVHVSDGTYPVTATLGVNNSVRVTDNTAPFLKENVNTLIPLLRISAGFSDNQHNSDPLVIYFDDQAKTTFDSDLDALKLMNTDANVPNLYAVSVDGRKLSINALPFGGDDQINIPIGLKIEKAGNIQFNIRDISNIQSGYEIYLNDNLLGSTSKLNAEDFYAIYLGPGEYNSRFTIILSKIQTGMLELESDDKLLNVYFSNGKLRIDMDKLPDRNGMLIITNIIGQILLKQQFEESDHLEINQHFNPGIYMVSVLSRNTIETRKIIILN